MVHLEQNLVAEFCSGRNSVADFIAHCHEVVDLLDPISAKDRPPATLDSTRTPIRGGNLAGRRAA